MTDVVLRDLSGKKAGPSAKVPGQPGTRRRNRLQKLAETYAGASPVEEARETGQFRAYETADIIRMDRDMGFFGPPAEDIDPAEIVMSEIRRSAGYVRDLEAEIQKLELHELILSDTTRIEEDKVGGGDSGNYTLTRTETRQEINKLWLLLERERKHLAQVANGAVKAGIELRRLQIKEAQLDRVQNIILLAAADLGIDTGDSRVRAAIGARIQELQNGDLFPTEPVKVTSERDPIQVPPPPADF